MSSNVSFQTLAYQVRMLTNDTDLSDLVVSTESLRVRMNNTQQEIAGEVYRGAAWSAAAVALADGTYDYSFQTGTPYALLLAVRLDSTGDLLGKVSVQAMEQMRLGNPVDEGDPQFYCVLESKAQATTVRLFPTPNATDALSILTCDIPSDFVLSNSSSEMSNPLEKAMILRVASQCLLGMTPEQLEKVKKGKEEAKLWLQQAERLLVGEKLRVSRLRRGTTRGAYPSWAGVVA